MQCSAVDLLCLSVCLSRVSNFSSPCGLFTSDFARCLLDTLVRVSACTSPLTRVPRTLTRTRSRWWSLSTTLRVFAPGQSVGRVSHSRVRVFRAEVYIRIGISGQADAYRLLLAEADRGGIECTSCSFQLLTSNSFFPCLGRARVRPTGHLHRFRGEDGGY